MIPDSNAPVPSFVVTQIGNRRVALPGEGVSELIASPVVHTFPHTTPLLAGVVVRRGCILAVLDLGFGVFGKQSPPGRFFLVFERQVGGRKDHCAIPIQGQCEFVSGFLFPSEEKDAPAIGFLDLNGERIPVLDLELTIAAGIQAMAAAGGTPEALS